MAGGFAAGFELGEIYSQICCCSKDMKEPVSISVVEGSEKYRIPTETPEKFLKKALRLTKPYGRMHDAGAAAFVVDEASEETAAEVKKLAMQITGIPESRICVIGRDEAFCAYVLNQQREIWRHQSVLFTLSGECLKAYVLVVNTRTTPMLARVEHEEGWSVPVSGLQAAQKDRILTGLARDVFSGRPVSSVYIVGEEFEENRYDESLRFICGSGRRVFAGNNLYAKGACYRAMMDVGREKPYIFLGADKIYYNVGLKVPGSGKKAVYTLLEAGTSRYEAHAQCEALLCGEPVVEFILVPMLGDGILRESLYLDGLPERPPRTTRLLISAEFLSADRLRFSVKDLGFGEIFASSELCWTEEVALDADDAGRDMEVR